MNGSKRNTLSLQAISGELLPEEQTYQHQLNAAIYNALGENDVQDVVKQIVKKAKEGDPQAQKLFFDYLLGAKTKPTTIQIHNHYPDMSSAGKKIEQDARAQLAKRLNGKRQPVPAGGDEDGE